MALDWIDVAPLSFNNMLLLESVQLSWFPGWLPEPELAVALRPNPAVEWYFRHKCPAIAPWVDQVLARPDDRQPTGADRVRQAELAVLKSVEDLLVYAIDPAIYDALPFLGWDDSELTDLVDFTGKTVLDVGAGTGRLAFAAAAAGAGAIYAVEPVANLRAYLKARARARGVENFYPVDGLITDIPFTAGFADITLGGHVFGDFPEQEIAELERVTRPGGWIVLCPGNCDTDSRDHNILTAHGFEWRAFIEPPTDRVRKYWKQC